MAFNLEQENARHAAGWRGFVIFTTVSTLAAAVVLLLMGATLL
jgi:hypothetical protein